LCRRTALRDLVDQGFGAEREQGAGASEQGNFGGAGAEQRAREFDSAPAPNFFCNRARFLH